MPRRTVLGFLLLGLTLGPLQVLAQDRPEAQPAIELPAPQLVGPRIGEQRQRASQKGGGNSQTEKAVVAGLEWLARHSSDGWWDADGFSDSCEEGSDPCEGVGKGQHGEDVACPFDAPISALATLAFLGHGHLPGAEDDPFGELVSQALENLTRVTDTWGLPLATQALAEAEALERKGRWKEFVDRNVGTLLARRGADGAWGYFPGAGRGSDVPYTALCVQALVTSRDAGAELPEDLGEEVQRFLATLEVKEGRLAYVKEGRRFGYTPTSSNAHGAAAVRHLLGVGLGEKGHRSGMSLIAKQKPAWKISFRDVKVPGRGKVPVQIGNLSMYQWWYGSVATFQAGGSTWTGWYGRAKGALVGHQEKRGCARGSWSPLGTYERQTGGRVFATALGCLILEQPYRHRRIER